MVTSLVELLVQVLLSSKERASQVSVPTTEVEREILWILIASAVFFVVAFSFPVPDAIAP